ncbi:P-loop containing nucleoside triphosphate hydrolase protein [Suillus placidus]|uniref:P-loop containing nucleoside triphosphate hydrolase protein n=1 Tax=Suillus placidus TaxID=48579 RepID=A0A9P6ZX23_9AGAM|nr:P-loop containing nucleoside triphosphate hydrolase protein [Suillus placidus]
MDQLYIAKTMTSQQGEQAHKVILVGVGGASCSGKTTVAKLLRNIIPNSVIIHQDDFAPPYEIIPYHPVHKVQDWDSAPTAIDWPKLQEFVKQVKQTGEIPPEHKSVDHLNKQTELPITKESEAHWKEVFSRLAEKSSDKVVWALVDGFLLYWDPVVVEHLDLKVFLRTPHDVLKERREQRATYITTEAETWTDAPNYWENIVWPAYVDGHKGIFTNDDVEHGNPREDVLPGLLLIEAQEHTMDDIVSMCCKHFVDYAERS